MDQNQPPQPRKDESATGLDQDISQFIYEDPRVIHGPNRARDDAKRALFHLLIASKKPAVLVAKEWLAVKSDYEFEHFGVYQKAAEEAGCSVKMVTRELNGGWEHLIFVAKERDLSDETLLACIDAPSTQPIGAHSIWAS